MAAPAAPRLLEVGMGLGSLAFAGAGLLAANAAARLAGVDPATARLVGLRDLASGLALLGGAGRPGDALLARGACDLLDGALFARRRPALAAFAGAAAAANLAAGLAARREARSAGAA